MSDLEKIREELEDIPEAPEISKVSEEPSLSSEQDDYFGVPSSDSDEDSWSDG